MEIFASLKSAGIYLAGDTVKCEVTFVNTQMISDKPNDDKIEHLAWASVQLQCICQVAVQANSSSGLAPAQRRESESLAPNLDSLTTSLQPLQEQQQKDLNIKEVFCTKPKILFCDLFLEPNESKEFEFEDTIPLSAPHSYNGRGLKYAYRLIIASQRLNRPIGTLKIPFRVLNGLKNEDVQLQESNNHPNLKSNNPSITNPFFNESSKEANDQMINGFNFLNEPSARRVATFYDIRNSKGRVGRLCLFKSTFRLGEEIMGLFDFSSSESQCMQYSVSLFCQEQIKIPTDAVGGEDRKSKAKVMLKQSVQEFSFGYDECNFTLTIPLHGTPSFDDDNCTLTWMLRFEFVISAAAASSASSSTLNAIQKQPILDETCTEGHEWNGPAHCQVETMTWNLPITVLPTNPKHVANVVHLQTEFSLVI